MGKAMWRKGDTVGAWQLVKRLGGGGNGVVWEANSPGQPLGAVKIAKYSSKRARLRFEQEITGQLELADERGILPILDHCDLAKSRACNGPLWLVTPKAIPLPKALRTTTPLKEAVTMCQSLAATLSTVHERIGAHRDIKPDNIFLLNGMWCLGDFGLICLHSDHALTKPGEKVGPVFFIAPEMLNEPDQHDGKKADVFSLAKVMWTLGTGMNFPIPGHLVQTEPQLRLSTYTNDAGCFQLDGLLDIATSTNPALRPSMKEFADELTIWLRPLKEASTMSDSPSLRDKIIELTGSYKNVESDNAARWKKNRAAQDRILSRLIQPTLEICEALIDEGFEPLNYSAGLPFARFIQLGHDTEILRHVQEETDVDLKLLTRREGPCFKGIHASVWLKHAEGNVTLNIHATVAQRTVSLGTDVWCPNWEDRILLAAGCNLRFNKRGSSKPETTKPLWTSVHHFHYESPSEDQAILAIEEDMNKNVRISAEAAIEQLRLLAEQNSGNL